MFLMIFFLLLDALRLGFFKDVLVKLKGNFKRALSVLKGKFLKFLISRLAQGSVKEFQGFPREF